jgi:subfamily B ATP-binding cassette protein MsbA
MRSFRRVLEILRPYRARVVFAVVLTLLVTVFQIAPPRLFQIAIDSAITPAVQAQKRVAELQAERALAREDDRPAIDARIAEERAVAEKRSPQILMVLAGALFLLVAVRNILSYWLSYHLNWIGNRFVFDLRFALWKHLQKLSLTFHNQTQTGKIMARATGDIELIQGLIQGQLVTFISDLVTLFGVTLMLFVLEWRLAIVIVCLIPFYVVSYLLFLKHIREVSQLQRKYWDEMLGKLAEKIAGIQVVKAFVREDYETENFMESVRAKFNVDMRQVHLNRRLGLVSGVVSALGTGIVYAYGGSLVQGGTMTSGQLVAFTFYIGFVFNPAVRVVDFNNALQWAVSAMDRVFQTLDTRPEIEDKPDAIALPEVRGEVVFDNVTFQYTDETTAIRNITLRVRPGEKIALVGHSGAGKTTLMNLLMRFYDPTSGRILIDGHDLRDLRLESLRRKVAMVAQENVLFSVTIAENIRYGNRDATDEQVVAASKAADLHSFIEELPEGYETMIGEHGIKLSGGQKQRLALARALVTDPAILILDDVTSALDGETEHRVQEALREVMKGRTTFIIAHRLSSVVEADRIVVLEGGEIVDIGSHAELVEKEGVYRDLYNEQFKSVLAGA